MSATVLERRMPNMERKILSISSKRQKIKISVSGSQNGFYGYDIYYNKTNYELAYTVECINGELIVVVMAGTRENFLAAISLLSFLVLSRVVHFNFFKCFFYFS